MANQTAQIGADFSSYVGDKNLGGYTGGAYEIDTKPLQNLADYTVLYNQTIWKQKKAETDKKIADLADLSNISLNDLRDKDKEYMIPKLTELFSKGADFARKISKNENERLQNELDWQKAYGAFKNDYNSGKQRSIAYQTQYNSILASAVDAKVKDAKIKLLDDKFNSTDIGTQISGVEDFNLSTIDVPEPVSKKINVVSVGGNDNLHIEDEIFIPSLNTGNSDAAVFGVKKLYPKKDSPEYNLLSPREKTQAEMQDTVESNGRIWVQMTEPFNEVRKKYVVNGKFNEQEFIKDNAATAAIMRPYNALKELDKYNKEKKAQAAQGMFTDVGVSPKIPSVKPEEFDAGLVDFSRDIAANKLVLAGSFAKFKGDVAKKAITHTGEANDLIKARLIQSGENYRANLPYTKLKEADKLKGKEQSDMVEQFGNILYNVNTPEKEANTVVINKTDGSTIKNLRIVNGSVLDAKGNVVNYTGDLKLPSTYFDNSIPVEYNKYVGGTKVDLTTGEVITTSSPTKLYNANGKYTVRMENGEIQGIYAESDIGGLGTLVSADQFKHITLTAAQKGATKYKKSDTGYGTITSQSGGSSTYTKEQQVPEYTREDYKKAGWTDKQIKQALDAGKIKLK